MGMQQHEKSHFHVIFLLDSLNLRYDIGVNTIEPKESIKKYQE